MDEQRPTNAGISHPDDSSDALSAAGSNLPVSEYASSTSTIPIESLDVHQEGQAGPAPVTYEPSRHAAVFSKRKALIISLTITGLVTLVTGVSLVFLTKHAPKPQSAAQAVKSQDVVLNNAQIAKIPNELQGSADSLLVNGDIVSRGNLKLSNSNYVTVLKTQDLTKDQSFILPNSTGTFCLDSNNCGYASVAQLTNLQQQVATLNQQQPQSQPVAAGVDSLNNQAGSVTIQGSLNQINVGTAGGVITLSTPQSLDANANVQFSNLTLNALGSGPVRASSGALSVGAINLATADVSGILAVPNGGTGHNTLAANAVLLGNGASPISTVTAGASGLCLVSTAGAPTFQACPGVTSVNGQGGAVTISSSAASVAITNPSLGTINLEVTYGSAANTAVQGNTTLTCTSGTGNLSGGGNNITLGTGGSCNLLDVVASPTFTGTLTVQGTSTTIGTNAVQGSLVLKDGSNNSGTIQTAALGQNTIYTLPDTGLVSAAFCLLYGANQTNCSGAGTNVTATTPGTANRIPVFTAGQDIANSYLLQSAGALTLDTSKDLVLAGGTSSFDQSAASGTFKTGTGAVSLNGNTSVTGSKTLTVGTGATTLGGTLDVTNTATFAGAVAANLGLSVGSGYQFTNNSSTLLGNSVLGDFPTGGSIGSAATTVDVKTTFNVNQTTAGQTLSLPSPTSLTVGRIVVVNNVGTATFTMQTIVIGPNHAQTFIWNGTAWVGSNIDGPDNAVTSIGVIDSQAKTADGASISNNTLYLQTADATYPGYVSTGAQTFAGNKTFNGTLNVVSAATFQNNLTVNAGGTVTFASLGAGLVQASAGGVLSSSAVNRNSSTYFSGTLTVANGGTNTTSFNANGLVVVNGAGTALTTLDGSAPKDGYVVTYDNSSGTFILAAANGGVSPCDLSSCAAIDLSNLTGVKINTSLLPDTTKTVDLGGSGANLGFRDLYLYGSDPSKDAIKLTVASNGGGLTQTLDAVSGTIAVLQNAGSSSSQTRGGGLFYDLNIDGNIIASQKLQAPLLKTADNAGGTSADLSLASGNTGATGNAGSITIDPGTRANASASGAQVNIGTTNARGVTIGHGLIGAKTPTPVTIQGLAGSGGLLLSAYNAAGDGSATLQFATPGSGSTTTVTVPTITGELAVIQSGTTAQTAGNISLNGNLYVNDIVPNAAVINIGTNDSSHQLVLQGSDTSQVKTTGSNGTTTLNFAQPSSSGNVTLNFPSLDPAGSPYKVCTTGNLSDCIGGGGVNAGTLTDGQFTYVSNAGSSQISSSSDFIYDSVNHILQTATGTDLNTLGTLTLGKNGASGTQGTITFDDGTNPGRTVTLKAAQSGSSINITLPDSSLNGASCLSLAGTLPNLSFIDGGCASGGSGSGDTNTNTSTQNHVPVFTATSKTITESNIFTDGSHVVVDGGLAGLTSTSETSLFTVFGSGSSTKLKVETDGSLSIGGAVSPFTISAAGAISNAASIAATGPVTISGTNNNELSLTGAPQAVNSKAFVQLGNFGSITNLSANGTYLGINSGSGFSGNFIDFENNGTHKLVVDSSGNFTTAGTYNGLTIDTTSPANGFILTGKNGKTLTVSNNATINQDLSTTSNTVQFGTISSLSTALSAGNGGTGLTAPTANGQLLIGHAAGTFAYGKLFSSDNSILVTDDFSVGGHPNDINLVVNSCSSCANVNLSNLGAIDPLNSNRPTQNVSVNTSIGAATGVDLGASTTWSGATPTTTLEPFRSLYLYGATGASQASNNLQITTSSISGLKVLTLPNLTGQAAVLQDVSAGQGTAQSAGGANTELSISGGLAATYVQTANAAVNTSSANLTIKTGSGNGTGSSGDVLVDVGAKGASGANGSIKLGTGANVPTSLIVGQTAATASGNVAVQAPGGLTIANSLGAGNSSANLVGVTAASGFDGNLLSLKTNATQEFRVDASGNTLAHGNLTVEGGTLTLGTGGATSITAGAGSLAVTSSNFNLSAAGVLTLAGAQTSDITTAGASTANALTIQPGSSSALNGTGAGLTLKAGDQSGTTCNATNCTGGTITIQGGSATGGAGTTRNGGNVSIDAGTGNTANGTVSIATGNASAVTLGRSTSTTTLQGNASTTLTANSGASSTQLAFVTPTAAVIYQFDTAAAGTYKVCTTANTGSSSACAPSAGSGNYVQNQFSATQSANYNIQSASSAQVTAVVKGAVGQSVDILQVATSSANVFTIGNTGMVTLLGGLTKDVTTADAAMANNLTLQPGVSTAANGTGATLTLKGGDQSGTTCSSANCTGGTITIQGGSATGGAGTTRNGGNVSIDAGTGNTANGTVSVGTANALTVTVGRAAGTTTLQGNASTTLTANNGANSTQVAFVTPTANVIYQFSTASAGTYQICTNAGAGGTSTCASSGGSGNYIQNQFSSSQSANYNIQSANSAQVTAVIKGAVSQSVDILQVATSSTTVFSVGSAGLVTVSGASPALRVGDTTNGISFNDQVSNQLRYRGTARNTRTIAMAPEFQNIVLHADGSNNNGTLTSDYDSSGNHNYYNWTTTQTNGDYDIYVHIPVPRDFDAFNSSGNTNVVACYYVWTDDSTPSNSTITAQFFDTGNVSAGTFTATPTSASTWQQKCSTTQYSFTTVTNDGNHYLTLDIHFNANQNKNTRIGEITMDYLSAF